MTGKDNEIADLKLDDGIKRAVVILRQAGIETFASCEGGAGHPYSEPTIRFHGERSEGFRALAVAMQHNLPARAVKRVWRLLDGEPEGPFWEMTFYRQVLQVL